MACAITASIAAVLVYCKILEVRAMASTPSYSAEIAPILQKNCAGCHSSTEHKSGLILDSYNSLMKGGRHGQVVLPHNAKGSRLLQMIEGTIDPQMPLEADPLSAPQIATLKAWIEAGAPGPVDSASTQPLTPQTAPDIRPEVKVISPVTAVRFSPDASVLAVGGYEAVRLIEPATDKLLATLSGRTDAVRSIAFSPGGKLIAASSGAPQSEGEIDIWDLQSHQLLKTMHGHKDCIYSIAWSPDGKLIASGSYDKLVKLWDVATGKEIRSLQDHIDAVFAVAFSPNGKHLASASQDRTVKIWDIATGRRLYTLSDASDGLTSIAYSKSGDQLAAGGYDKTIYIWRLAEENGHLSQSLIADEDSLLAMLWSPDSKMIITASSDRSIRFRDAATLDPMRVIDKQSDWVQALDISSDGKWLAAGRYDGTLSLYDVKSYQELRPPTLVFDLHLPPTANTIKEVAGK
jgi:WD40 repeat protein